jgi:hypothetical protein
MRDGEKLSYTGHTVKSVGLTTFIPLWTFVYVLDETEGFLAQIVSHYGCGTVLDYFAQFVLTTMY